MKSKIFLCIILLITAFSCEYSPIVPDELPNGPISFATQVEPIFSNSNKCTACHKTGNNKLDLTTGNAYQSLVQNNTINTDNPEESLIYTVPVPTKQHGANYSQSEANLVLAWIKQGALDN